MANTALSQKVPHLIATASPSGASTVDFTGISADYGVYMLTLTSMRNSADHAFYLRTSTDGGSSYDSGLSDYAWATMYATSATDQSLGDAADSEITLLTGAGGTGTNEDFNGIVYIANPSTTDYTQIWWSFGYVTSSGGHAIVKGFGQRLSAADVDAIRLLPSTGTITGEIRLYGFKI